MTFYDKIIEYLDVKLNEWWIDVHRICSVLSDDCKVRRLDISESRIRNCDKPVLTGSFFRCFFNGLNCLKSTHVDVVHAACDRSHPGTSGAIHVPRDN